MATKELLTETEEYKWPYLNIQDEFLVESPWQKFKRKTVTPAVPIGILTTLGVFFYGLSTSDKMKQQYCMRARVICQFLTLGALVGFKSRQQKQKYKIHQNYAL